MVPPAAYKRPPFMNPKPRLSMRRRCPPSELRVHRPGPPSLSVLPDRGISKVGLLRSWPVAEHRGESSLLVVPNSQLAPGPPSLGLLWVRRKEPVGCHCTRRYSKPTAGERNARLSRPQPVVLPVCTLRGAESTTARIVAPPPRRAARARAHTHNERTLCARICRSGAPIEYSEYRKVLRAGAVAAEGDGLIGPWRASTCPQARLDRARADDGGRLTHGYSQWPNARGML